MSLFSSHKWSDYIREQKFCPYFSRKEYSCTAISRKALKVTILVFHPYSRLMMSALIMLLDGEMGHGELMLTCSVSK